MLLISVVSTVPGTVAISQPAMSGSVMVSCDPSAVMSEAFFILHPPVRGISCAVTIKQLKANALNINNFFILFSDYKHVRQVIKIFYTLQILSFCRCCPTARENMKGFLYWC